MAPSLQISPIGQEDSAIEEELNSIKNTNAGSVNVDEHARLRVAKYHPHNICFFENYGILKEAPFFSHHSA